jgi:uncharacterized protein involved in oxidation of intracellular sulfur
MNDAPYGTEKAYNAMRLAMTLQSVDDDIELRIFLLADSVSCALPNQTTPQGYFNIETMFKAVIKKGGLVSACGTCAKARGINDLNLIEGIKIGSMMQLSEWVVDSDKILTF